MKWRQSNAFKIPRQKCHLDSKFDFRIAVEICDDDEIGGDESYDESENMDNDEASLLEKDHTANRILNESWKKLRLG